MTSSREEEQRWTWILCFSMCCDDDFRQELVIGHFRSQCSLLVFSTVVLNIEYIV